MAHGLVAEVHEELTGKRWALDEQLVELRERLAETQDKLRLIDAQLEVLDRLRSTNGATPPSVKKHAEKPARPNRGSNVAKSIRRLVKAEPGLTPVQITDRLESVVRTSSAKGSRRVISNRIWLLKSKGRVVERDGRIYLATGNPAIGST